MGVRSVSGVGVQCSVARGCVKYIYAPRGKTGRRAGSVGCRRSDCGASSPSVFHSHSPVSFDRDEPRRKILAGLVLRQRRKPFRVRDVDEESSAPNDVIDIAVAVAAVKIADASVCTVHGGDFLVAIHAHGCSVLGPSAWVVQCNTSHAYVIHTSTHQHATTVVMVVCTYRRSCIRPARIVGTAATRRAAAAEAASNGTETKEWRGRRTTNAPGVAGFPATKGEQNGHDSDVMTNVYAELPRLWSIARRRRASRCCNHGRHRNLVHSAKYKSQQWPMRIPAART